MQTQTNETPRLFVSSIHFILSFFPTESEKSKGSRSSQIKLHILLSCHLLPRNSPPRSNQNYSKARFKAEGVGGSQGSEAGGDG